MPYVWKTEYHVIGADDEAFAWEDTLEDAMKHEGAVRIEEVTYYLDDRETVWEADDQ